MGIANLLPFLDNITKPVHVADFKGCTVAVDTYCWLHKAARSCSFELAMGEPTNVYVNYCLKLVNMLLLYQLTPIMVFDGRPLPAKVLTEDKRRESKNNARMQGMELLRLGRKEQACKFFRQCIDVTPEMASNLIKQCREMGVECIVAPYESDAQLAFFNMKGVVDFVISEDSDLLLFGCKKVLYKMDVFGNGFMVDAQKIHVCMKIKEEEYTLEKFRHMCILSGCDYLDSLPGIGLKKALKFITMTAETKPELFLDRIPRYLNMRNLHVTKEYKENFMIADATFKHQIVFDPYEKKLVPLNPISTSLVYVRNAGALFDNEEAYQLALGNLNPLTMEKIDDFSPPESVKNNPNSIWAKSFTPRPQKKVQKPLAKERKPTKRKHRDIEGEADAYDQQIEKELEYYKRPHAEAMPGQSSNMSDSEDSDNQKKSPKLNTFINGNNPFIKKKLEKLSKFQATNVPAGEVVKSRFFTASNTEEPIECESDDIEDNQKSQMSSWHRWNSPQQRADDFTSSETSGAPEMSSGVPTPPTPEQDMSDLGTLCEMENLTLEHTLTENYISDVENSTSNESFLCSVEVECLLSESDSEYVPPNNTPTLSTPALSAPTLTTPALASVENLAKSTDKKRKREDESQVRKREYESQVKRKKQATIIEMFKKMRSQ